MRVLITGGTGFVGSHLARRYAAEGADVHVIVRESSDRTVLDDVPCTFHTDDGRVASLVGIVREAAPSVTFHLASRFVAEHTTDQIAEMTATNLAFGVNLLEAHQRTGHRLLVSAGTSWQHHGGQEYDPVCLYAAMKQAFEDLAQYWVSAHGFAMVVLKLFDTYGPRDRRGKLFAALHRAAFEGEPLQMSPGAQQIDLVHVDDVVDALVRAAASLQEDPSPSIRRYGVSSGAPLSLREVVQIYSDALGRPVPVRWGARPYRAREVMVPWDGRPALPGWAPKVPLREGIERMLARDA